MAPIGLLFIVGFVIALERWLFLRGIDSSNRRALQDITHAISVADTAKIQQAAKHQEAPVLAMLSQGIGRMAGVHRRDDLEYAMEEVILEYSLRLQKRTPMLATLANIATLLGLLGTIMGLITAFAAVANADPAEKSQLIVIKYFGRDEHYGAWLNDSNSTGVCAFIIARPHRWHYRHHGNGWRWKLMNALAQKQSGGRDDQKA